MRGAARRGAARRRINHRRSTSTRHEARGGCSCLSSTQYTVVLYYSYISPLLVRLLLLPALPCAASALGARALALRHRTSVQYSLYSHSVTALL